MHNRSILGAANVSDAQLAEMVRQAVTPRSTGDVVVLESVAEVAPYDLAALTTGGRYWVRGRAATAEGEVTFAFFVKVVQSFARSPMFAEMPPAHQQQALGLIPWRTEPLLYRSDLPARLPAGLSMPRAHAVVDLDDESCALWLEGIEVADEEWDLSRYAHVASLLGQLAASDSVRPLARIGQGDGALRVRGYAESRVKHQLVPALLSDELWTHPLMSAFDDELREGLQQSAANVPSIVDEIESLPTGTFHGDACSRNVLVQQGSRDLVLIDYGFWGEGPLGFDLGQLLMGEVQVGDRPASWLPELEAACLPAYVAGLRSEGCPASQADVRRAHALLLLLFSGLSAVPFEHLDEHPTAELLALAEQRAEILRFILGLVHTTA